MADQQVVIGASIKVDGSGAEQSVNSFRTQLTKARNEVIELTNQYGAMDARTVEAAKHAGELFGQIQEARKTMQAFNPEQRFAVIGQSIRGVTGGFEALQGVIGLTGTKSEELEKTLLRVQSAMAISQGLNELQEGLKGLERAIAVLGTGPLLILTALAAAVTFLVTQLKGANEESEQMKKITEAGSEAFAKATVDVEQMRIKIEQAKKGIGDKNEVTKEYNKTIGATVGYAKDLNEAEDALNKNAAAYIHYTQLKAEANEALSQSAKIAFQIDQLITAKAPEGPKFIQEQFEKAKQKTLETLNEQKSAIDSLFTDLEKRAADASAAFKFNGVQGQKDADDAAKKAAEAAKKAKEDAEKKAEFDKELKALYDEEKKKQLVVKESQDAISGIKKTAGNEQVKDAIDLAGKMNSIDQLQTAIEGKEVAKRVAQAEAEAAAKITAMQNIGAVTAELSNLVGQTTAIGKGLALAQVAIDEGVAISGAIRQASENPLNLTGWAFIADMAARIGAIISGVVKAKQIISSANTSGGNISMSAPSLSSISSLSTIAPLKQQTSTSTQLQNIAQLINNQGNAAIKTYVVTSDVTNNQERLKKINRAAQLGK